MSERTGLVTLLGTPMTLVGTPVSVGDAAPDATVLDNDLNPVALSSFKGKVCVLKLTASKLR